MSSLPISTKVESLSGLWIPKGVAKACDTAKSRLGRLLQRAAGGGKVCVISAAGPRCGLCLWGNPVLRKYSAFRGSMAWSFLSILIFSPAFLNTAAWLRPDSLGRRRGFQLAPAVGRKPTGRTRQGSGEVAMTCSADAPMHTIKSASATEHTGKRSGNHCTVIQRYNSVTVVVFFGYAHTQPFSRPAEPRKQATQRGSPACCAPQPRPHGRARLSCRLAGSLDAGGRRAAAPRRCG